MTQRWHILTPEVPPICGGVGDYTAQVAEALALKGDDVAVFSPPAATAWRPPANVRSIALPDRFGSASLRALTACLERDTSPRVLVQYVPSAFGRRGTNIAFCRWARSRRQAGNDVRVMFHEPYLSFHWRPDHFVTALGQRSMAATLLEASTHVYLSTESWRAYLRRLGPDAVQRAITLPVPSAIPHVRPTDPAVAAVRSRAIGASVHLVGHFGSYGDHIAPLLRGWIAALLAADPGMAVLCTGAGSDRFVQRLQADEPALRRRVSATGRASSREIAVHIQACDVLLQPYPDGVTTRRTSVMAALANGRPVVTTEGRLTEPIWRGSGCVALVRLGDTTGLVEVVLELLNHSRRHASLASRALTTYASCFRLHHTIAALRSDRPQTCQRICVG